MELLIVDEVSMLRADVLDAMDYMLQFIRRNHEPFGGRCSSNIIRVCISFSRR